MGQGIAQILVFVAVLIAAAYPFGLYMARVFADDGGFLSSGRLRFLGGAETTFNLDDAFERVQFGRAGCYRLVNGNRLKS